MFTRVSRLSGFREPVSQAYGWQFRVVEMLGQSLVKVIDECAKGRFCSVDGVASFDLARFVSGENPGDFRLPMADAFRKGNLVAQGGSGTNSS